MQKRNYQKELEKLLSEFEKEEKRPSLLLHGCCAPCSSYCLWYLSRYFKIMVFFYNPNISYENEYEKRWEELVRLVNEMPLSSPVELIKGSYEPDAFYEMAKGLEKLPEGGERCFRCYELRLRETAKMAVELGVDYFTTTLSISPHKNAEKLNEIGEKLAKEYGCRYLLSDFKKKEGYKKSIEFSREYNLYRQDYCGCIYSKNNKETDSFL